MLNAEMIAIIIGCHHATGYSIIKRLKEKYKLDYKEKTISKSILMKEYKLTDEDIQFSLERHNEKIKNATAANSDKSIKNTPLL